MCNFRVVVPDSASFRGRLSFVAIGTLHFEASEVTSVDIRGRGELIVVMSLWPHYTLAGVLTGFDGTCLSSVFGNSRRSGVYMHESK